MNKSINPLVSVIVLAYDRKRYLMNAVTSVLNQEIDRSDYEIIVSKNFQDESIDKFLEDNHVISIIDNVQGIGPRLGGCLLKARGEIISFLEDDDAWEPNKLSNVINAFLGDDRVGYYHNAYLPINEDGIETKEWIHHKNIKFRKEILPQSFTLKDIVHLVKFSPNFNMSSISISRRLAMQLINDFSKIRYAVDTFLFVGSIFYGFAFIIDNKKLTRYKIHQSNMNQKTNDFGEFITGAKLLYEEHYLAFKEMLKIFKHSFITKLLISYEREWELRLNLLEAKKHRTQMLNVLVNDIKYLFLRRDYAMFLYLLATIFVVSPYFAQRIYYFYLMGAISKY